MGEHLLGDKGEKEWDEELWEGRIEGGQRIDYKKIKVKCKEVLYFILQSCYDKEKYTALHTHNPILR